MHLKYKIQVKHLQKNKVSCQDVILFTIILLILYFVSSQSNVNIKELFHNLIRIKTADLRYHCIYRIITIE